MNKELITKLLTGVFAKYIRYAIAIPAGSAALKATGNENVDVAQLATGAAGVIVALVWSHLEDWWKKREVAKVVPMPVKKDEIQPGITPIPAFILACFIGLSALTGCTTMGQKSDPARVARLAGAAAGLSSTAYLLQHPEDRRHFEAVRVALTGLESSGNYSPDAFAKALQALPIKELRGKNGVLIVGAAVIAWNELKVEFEHIDRAEWVKPVLQSVNAGLARALNATAPPPKVP